VGLSEAVALTADAGPRFAPRAVTADRHPGPGDVLSHDTPEANVERVVPAYVDARARREPGRVREDCEKAIDRLCAVVHREVSVDTAKALGEVSGEVCGIL